MFVKYNRENVKPAYSKAGGQFLFIPGVNEVPREVWDRLMENKHFKNDFEKNYGKEDPMFEVVNETEPGPPNENGEPEPAFVRVQNQQDKTRIIKETYDVKALKEMRRNETNRAVVELIDAQIAHINRRGGRDRPGEE